jgi:hypothetical protein
VIPQTIAALLGFLFLVAPGLTFELLREHRRPPINETAFREASRVALASLAFTVVSLIVLIAGRAIIPSLLPDPAEWSKAGKAYIKDHYQLIAIASLLELIIACGIAALMAGTLGVRSRARIDPYSLWYMVLRQWPKRNELPLAMVEMDNGGSFFGRVRAYSHDKALVDRELVLGRPLYYQPDEDSELTNFGEDWKYIIVPISSIKYMAVDYWQRNKQE